MKNNKDSNCTCNYITCKSCVAKFRHENIEKTDTEDKSTSTTSSGEVKEEPEGKILKKTFN